MFTNYAANTLDLIITNCDKCKVPLAVEQLFKIDDAHSVLNIEIDFVNSAPSKIKYLNFNEFEKFYFFNSYVMINKEIGNVKWNITEKS